MFYKQSVNDVEMVILCLDGGILDLNRLRYNYFNRICKQYNYSVSKEEFTTMLGNSETMYNQSPIQDTLKDTNINELIEKDLYEYAKLKQNIKKDGVDELLQFFKQKKIKVVVISTHKTKRAIQYLQLTRIYQYIDFVIGGDSQHMPLPDSSILHTVCTQMHVEKERAVVIANFPSLVKAANDLFMNVIYLQDLAPTSTNINASVYKTVKNNLEMINVFLFSKYDTVEMFSSVLGMSKDMDLVTLEKAYQRLLLEYQDDLQLIALVKKTYRFFLMEINDVAIQSKKTKTLDAVFTVETDNSSMIDDISKVDTFTSEIENSKVLDTNDFDITDDSILTTIESISTNKDSTASKSSSNVSIPKSFEQDAMVLNDLMNKINKTSLEDEMNNSLNNANNIEKEQEAYSLINKILDFVYISIVSSIISVIATVCYMILNDYLQKKSIITSAINTIIDFYITVVRSTYMCIFDGIHTIITFIPDYQSLVEENRIFSSLAVEIILFTIFNIIIYYIIKGAYHLINKRSRNSD